MNEPKKKYSNCIKRLIYLNCIKKTISFIYIINLIITHFQQIVNPETKKER